MAVKKSDPNLGAMIEQARVSGQSVRLGPQAKISPTSPGQFRLSPLQPCSTKDIAMWMTGLCELPAQVRLEIRGHVFKTSGSFEMWLNTSSEAPTKPERAWSITVIL
jgi:hypothetical protein